MQNQHVDLESFSPEGIHSLRDVPKDTPYDSAFFCNYRLVDKYMRQPPQLGSGIPHLS
jgi:hypothetical protein